MLSSPDSLDVLGFCSDVQTTSRSFLAEVMLSSSRPANLHFIFGACCLDFLFTE